MINEASKSRIAKDIIEYKIAQVFIELRDCEDDQKKKELKERCEKLMDVREEISKGNIKYIDELIKRNEVKRND